ncbi:DUF3306 domain-containing protein [Massilia endophytica]|uniref:DUF3306 domain-containing protein n=1 Tax=Massilia endophytica TaxID=2899220 RepID=UPI001E2EB7A8|nr:DUF3306 domain-containing protein [Massilia endophytica]UGQ48104.1 DUF3306 domain-containing protein [Massilia endophytica]
MAAETFFARWSRRKAEVAAEREDENPVVPVPAAPEPPEALPTMEQLAELDHTADLKPFVARGVDEGVRRAAMKKLFADPRFNVMDGLDTYIGDYNRPDPMPAAMLAALNHAKDLLDPLGVVEREQTLRGLLAAADLEEAAEQDNPTEAPAPSQDDDEHPIQSM